MHLLKPSKIQTKFVSGLLVASIVLGIVFSVGFYLHMKNVLEEEVRDKALLIFTHVLASLMNSFSRQGRQP